MTQSSKTLSPNQVETTSVGTLNLRLSNGTTLALPPSLDIMATYVVLEQGTWFEKELAFLPHLLKPGMSAIDIPGQCRPVQSCNGTVRRAGASVRL